jgi:hypothetical protein
MKDKPKPIIAWCLLQSSNSPHTHRENDYYISLNAYCNLICMTITCLHISVNKLNNDSFFTLPGGRKNKKAKTILFAGRKSLADGFARFGGRTRAHYLCGLCPVCGLCPGTMKQITARVNAQHTWAECKGGKSRDNRSGHSACVALCTNDK